MSGVMPSHFPRDPECTCDRDVDLVVCFENAALWHHGSDGWTPVPNRSRQRGRRLHEVGSHRVAVLSDVTATKGARRGSFVGDGTPVDDVRFSDRVPDYLVVWPEWDEYWRKRVARETHPHTDTEES